MGGKIGFVAGPAVAFMASPDVIGLIFGDCFFEEGCSHETIGLVGADILSLLIGMVVALSVRAVVNRLVKARL